MSDSQKKYAQTRKGKEALARARKKYDESDLERRRQQKREYMRKKRAQNPNYCKWKNNFIISHARVRLNTNVMEEGQAASGRCIKKT